MALPNGRPCEDRIILKEFEKLREKAGLPRVVFHSLRHSSTTYKLKLNHGDLKATQGDTGHAEIDMITSVYAHILDEDRKINAQKFESAFYAKPDLRAVRPAGGAEGTGTGDARPGGPGGTAPAVAGTGKYPGCAALGGTRRQVSPKTPISKDGIFLSKNVEIVRFFLAGYTLQRIKFSRSQTSKRPGEAK